MQHQGGWIQKLLRSSRGHGGTLLGLVMAVGLLSLPALAFGADAVPAAPVEYRDVPYVGSRNIIWVIAQLHLLLAGFVLGVPIFAWLCEIVAWKTGEKRYDKLAKEFTKLLTSAYATTSLFGGILLFLLISFYPKLMNYLTDIFFPSFIVYCMLFFDRNPERNIFKRPFALIGWVVLIVSILLFTVSAIINREYLD